MKTRARERAVARELETPDTLAKGWVWARSSNVTRRELAQQTPIDNVIVGLVRYKGGVMAYLDPTLPGGEYKALFGYNMMQYFCPVVGKRIVGHTYTGHDKKVGKCFKVTRNMSVGY